MVELLEDLKAKGIKMAVNSNKSDEFTKELISRNYPGIDFVVVYGAREGVAHKPDPVSALETAELMGLKPEEIAYVGDSDVDMKTGKNAGMKTIGCLWGYRDEQLLRESGADYIVFEPKEIELYL
jgi:phosphoglycolate phosphatase